MNSIDAHGTQSGMGKDEVRFMYLASKLMLLAYFATIALLLGAGSWLIYLVPNSPVFVVLVSVGLLIDSVVFCLAASERPSFMPLAGVIAGMWSGVFTAFIMHIPAGEGHWPLKLSVILLMYLVPVVCLRREVQRSH